MDFEIYQNANQMERSLFIAIALCNFLVLLPKASWFALSFTKQLNNCKFMLN